MSGKSYKEIKEDQDMEKGLCSCEEGRGGWEGGCRERPAEFLPDPVLAPDRDKTTVKSYLTQS